MEEGGGGIASLRGSLSVFCFCPRSLEYQPFNKQTSYSSGSVHNVY